MASGKVTGITWGFTAREQNSTDASRFTRVFEFRNIENYKIDEKLVGFCPQKLQSETLVMENFPPRKLLFSILEARWL